jgi:purine-nucleoside phosphorylase
MDPESFDRAAQALPPDFFDPRPACALVLGSGWSQAVESVKPLARVAYARIPGLGASTVAGHAGELVLFESRGLRVAAFCGRRHWYEGEGWTPVVLPVELARRMGVRDIVLTNAAGGIRAGLQPGDLMLVLDHVNAAFINPLQGPVRPGWGPRFPDQSEVYSRELGLLLRKAANDADTPLTEGVYVFTAGPSYETPAEVRAFGHMGADAVGMSTVPEAIVANAMGLRVAALSCIANTAAGLSGPHLSHDEVLAATRRAAPSMARLLHAFLRRLADARRPGPPSRPS